MRAKVDWSYVLKQYPRARAVWEQQFPGVAPERLGTSGGTAVAGGYTEDTSYVWVGHEWVQVAEAERRELWPVTEQGRRWRKKDRAERAAIAERVAKAVPT
jgi:hypothetical protein